MDQARLEELQRQLTSDRSDLVSQLTDMGVDPETGAPDRVTFEQGFADSGQATAEKARVLSIAEGLVDSLREIDAAHERIEKGTYGDCELCGKEIPAERLEARPSASLCMDCKRRSA
jgi:DnaK suppressor protein